ncbi:SDR family NAD(P)-dependent oxidoreductase [Streptomyces sp. tea 10]|nr:SDR family NAD(P)-dependent oxidoreductase [Streptomyces sp. tea 10]
MQPRPDRGTGLEAVQADPGSQEEVAALRLYTGDRCQPRHRTRTGRGGPAREGATRLRRDAAAQPGRSHPAAQAAQIEAVAEQIEDLDVLVNNAGLAIFDDFGDRQVLSQHLTVNFFGPEAVTQAFTPHLPHLRRSRGAMVNVLSLATLASVPGWRGTRLPRPRRSRSPRRCASSSPLRACCSNAGTPHCRPTCDEPDGTHNGPRADNGRPAVQTRLRKAHKVRRCRQVEVADTTHAQAALQRSVSLARERPPIDLGARVASISACCSGPT